MLCDAVCSVAECTKAVRYEVIVVDNGSEDESLDELDRAMSALPFEKEKPSLSVIRLGVNTGFACANNRGLEAARGRNILFLNPDTLLKNDAVSILSDYLDSHPETGVCGGNLIDKEGREQFSYWPLLPGVRMEWNELLSNIPLKWRNRGAVSYNRTGKPKDVGYIIGADLMTRRSVLNEAGNFSEDFFLFYEETELCFRIRKAGYAIVSVPQARMVHLESQTIGSRLQREKYLMPSRCIYLNKCTSKAEHILADAILFVNCLLRLSWFTLIRNRDKMTFWKYRLSHISPATTCKSSEAKMKS